MRARDSQSGDAALAAPRIWGKYRFSGRVDAGDQRLMYRGVEVATGRQVTVEILTKPALDEQFDERLSRAVEIFARSRSEQLVAVYEHGVTQDGMRFVAMAPLVGQSLAARLKARRRLPVAEAIPIACAVAEVIAGFHRRQVVYGALEPSRVFLTPSARGGYRVRLLLGVPRPPTGTAATLSGRISDQRSGTYLAGGEALYGFLSPEQLTRQPSFASDVFAVGALTYAMIAGAPPFARVQSPDVAPLEPLSARVKDAAIAPAIDATLARALAFDPESRQRSLEELIEDLRALHPSDAIRLVRPAAETVSSLPEPESLLGTAVGRYRVERCLAASQDGLIFRATDQTSKAAVNLTVFVVTSDTERELGERLASADRLRANSVSGFVDVLESGYLSSGVFYVVSDAWEETLADRLRVERPMPASAVVALIGEVAAALDAMHACGEVHRELAPSNIVFAEADRANPKLLVVSAPRRTLADEASREGVPRTLAAAARSVRSIFGACAYASPEEAISGWIGVRSNVYSLAVIAYEMLTGTALFDESSPMTQLVRHLASPVDPPSRRAPEGSIPAQWDEPFVRALSKQASARFVSAADFAEELVYALESAPPPRADPARSDPMATEASVVVPLIRTLSHTSAVEPSVVVPLTRLAGSRGSSSPPPRVPEDSDWDWDSEPDSQADEAALPLTRQAAIPLVTQRLPPLFAAAESAPTRDSLKKALLALAVVALAAGLWFAARYLR